MSAEICGGCSNSRRVKSRLGNGFTLTDCPACSGGNHAKATWVYSFVPHCRGGANAGLSLLVSGPFRMRCEMAMLEEEFGAMRESLFAAGVELCEVSRRADVHEENVR